MISCGLTENTNPAEVFPLHIMMWKSMWNVTYALSGIWPLSLSVSVCVFVCVKFIPSCPTVESKAAQNFNLKL